jgi:site-specific recombinase XerD
MDELVPAESVLRPPSSVLRYARAEKAESTRRAYAKDLRAFVAWRERGVTASAAFPASAGEVAAWLAECADAGLSVSTIQRRAAAICFAHRQLGFDSPTASGEVKAVLRGIRRTLGVAAAAKAPATAAIVARMVKKIPDTLAGKRDRALILIGFAAALRRSELADLNVGAIERADGGIVVHVGKSKTDQEGRGAEIAVPFGAKLKAIEALDAWIAAAALTGGPLFRRIGKGGRLTAERLSGHAVAVIVKQRAAAVNLDPAIFSGHSIRAGFVSSALEAGSDILKVMDVTRHRDVQTLKTYDRRGKLFKDHAGKKFL